jgi:hypothetical protein
MCDKLVFDLSQEVEGSPNVFIRKDWINILDNQNQNYQNNQSIIDTSQLSNSNKYMGYREAYLAVPLLLSVVTPQNDAVRVEPNYPVLSANPTGQEYGYGDYTIGLKNWFGQIIHSFTLDYNGTTIIQQTPFVNMWNTFKLLTTLSYSDIITQGPIIGFYPDCSSSWTFVIPNTDPVDLLVGSFNGIGVCNNDYTVLETQQSSNLSASGNQFNNHNLNTGLNTTTNINNVGVGGANIVTTNFAIGGNTGATKRLSWINYNPNVKGESSFNMGIVGVSSTACDQIWKSYISQQLNGATGLQSGLVQISVMATIYLKHISSFFNMVPLLKGVFMKMTMNLNNASTSVVISPFTVGVLAGANAVLPVVSSYQATVPVGGVNPILIPSFRTGSAFAYGMIAGPTNLVNPAYYQCVPTVSGTYFYNLSVGSNVIGTVTATNYNTSGVKLGSGKLSKSIYLYVPAYTFNPVFEEAYLSNPVKQIKYTDIYQYQVQNITGNGQGQFNNLITNGIANIKSVLIIPFYSQKNTVNGAPFDLGSPEYQSPFDTAGCGTTAPMVTLGNFNVQISGQNAIYNTQRYSFEEFNNQLYGQYSVNGGLTDGLTSGLISYQDFLQSYCYYYVNVERMLPVEQSVPKSVQILGTNYSTQSIDMWVFIEYGVEINIDLTTGARV